MALQKSMPTEFGDSVSATYWNIGSYHDDFKNKGANVTMYGYANQDARTAEKQPLSAWKYSVPPKDYIAGMTRADVYNLVKTLPEWGDSIDLV